MLGPLQDSLADTKFPLNPQQQERQKLIYRNASRLLKLVNSLLDFSRIEANRIQAIYEPTDLAKLTTDLASCFDSAMENAGLKYTLQIFPIDEPVYVDKEMWEKIIFNLVSNAFKFTLKGEIKILLRKLSNSVELQVQDTGAGIPSQHLPKLFERFQRIEGTKGRSFEGTGIGLALVKELIKLHGGTIDVNSKENEGSIFVIHIPLGVAHLPKEKLAQSREHYRPAVIGKHYVEEASGWLLNDSQNSTQIMKKMDSAFQDENAENIKSTSPPYRILLADDSPDMRSYVKGLLSEYWQIDAVVNGELALEAALNTLPDLIISDVMMPKMNGFELVQKLRSDHRTKLIPIILLSARAGEEARIEGLKAGADDYLVKPFSSKELITRVGAQLELCRVRVQLEEMVMRRTQELFRAYELLRLEMDFISTVCHEIRNPLNVTNGAVSLLQYRISMLKKLLKQEGNTLIILDAEQFHHLLIKINEDLNALEYCGRQQKIIVDDVLNLSRLEANKVELHPISFSLKTEFDRIIHMFNPQFEEKNLKLRPHLPEEDVYLKADIHRVSQIINNLLSNAIKFTREGYVILSVTVDKLSENETELKVVVEDSGVGMTKDEMAQLFKQFGQGNSQIVSQYGGSGLGLVISKKLVEKMGGTIEVKSEKDRGSVFSFTIRCINLTENEKLAYVKNQGKRLFDYENKSSCEEERLSATPSTKTILIVEDNQMNQRILVNFLELKGYLYHIANNGLEALEKFKNLEFDLILMDIEMPIMKGLEATKKIREIEQGKNKATPIIGLSGNALEEQIQASKQVGMDDYLTKPVQREELYKIIDLYTSENSPTLKKLKYHQETRKEETLPPVSSYAKFALLTQRDSVRRSAAGGLRSHDNKDSAKVLSESNNRYSCFKAEDNHLKELLQNDLPPYVDFGEAIGKGDCFFDTVAQCLNDDEDRTDYNYRALRILCEDYIKFEKHAWVKTAVEKDGGNFEDYLARIRFSAQEMEDLDQERVLVGTAEWGSPHIEGRMICEKLQIKLHLIEVRKATSELPAIIIHQIIDANGSYSISADKVDYLQPGLIHVVSYNNHCIPLLFAVRLRKSYIPSRKCRTESDSIMMAVDKNYRFTELNDFARIEFFKEFGVEIKVGDSLIEATRHEPTKQEKALKLWEIALAGNAIENIEEFVERDGCKQNFKVTLIPLKDENGNVIGAMNVIRKMDVKNDSKPEEQVGQKRKGM